MAKKKLLPIAQLGEKVLRKKAKKIRNNKNKKIKILIKNMLYTLKKSNGVGLAAPQVFHSFQILIIASKANPRYPKAITMKPMVLINPKIIKTSNKKIKDWEGCLSIPGIRAKVPRHKKITLSYTTLKGKQKTVTYKGFIARIFQHEYDHLLGKVYIDHVQTKDIVSESYYLKKVKNS